MPYTELHRRLSSLRGAPVRDAHQQMVDLMPAIESAVEDLCVSDEEACRILTKAIRTLTHRVPAVTNRKAGLIKIRQTLEHGPRPVGRVRAEGPPRIPSSIRLTSDEWQFLEAVAKNDGVSVSGAVSKLIRLHRPGSETS